MWTKLHSSTLIVISILSYTMRIVSIDMLSSLLHEQVAHHLSTDGVDSMDDMACCACCGLAEAAEEAEAAAIV